MLKSKRSILLAATFALTTCLTSVGHTEEVVAAQTEEAKEVSKHEVEGDASKKPRENVDPNRPRPGKKPVQTGPIKLEAKWKIESCKESFVGEITKFKCSNGKDYISGVAACVYDFGKKERQVNDYVFCSNKHAQDTTACAQQSLEGSKELTRCAKEYKSEVARAADAIAVPGKNANQVAGHRGGNTTQSGLND